MLKNKIKGKITEGESPPNIINGRSIIGVVFKDDNSIEPIYFGEKTNEDIIVALYTFLDATMMSVEAEPTSYKAYADIVKNALLQTIDAFVKDNDEYYNKGVRKQK